MTRAATFTAITCMLLILGACSTDAPRDFQPDLQGGPAYQPAAGNPASLPADGVQPWEQQDSAGLVVPTQRSASSININTDFTPGVEYFQESGDVADNLEAARINGTDDSATSYVIYRISMGSAQPGIVSVDANLLAAGGFYVGLTDYLSGRWDWQGPFNDSHVRLPAVLNGNGDMTNDLGNSFVCVLCPVGSSVDVVGIGVNQYDPASATAPATPAGLGLLPVPGGIELSWLPVLENDLAGYAIYYSDRSFISPQSAGVRRVPYLEGSTRHMLSGISSRTHVAISAIDFGGNESAITPLQSAVPLAGEAPGLSLTADLVSGGVNSAIQLSASGADSYDWDLDGDGVFEIAGDGSGQQSADTSATGIIRPRVRAVDGEAVALGGLSLIINGNTRPVASATADPQNGLAPLSVTFTGTAEDSEDETTELEFAWDFDGDGIYEADTDTLSPVPQEYGVAGLFNAKFRATDTEGAWDVDTVSLSVESNLPPIANLSAPRLVGEAPLAIHLDASDSFDPDGTIIEYEWDPDGDGNFNVNTFDRSNFNLTMLSPGERTVSVRVTDDNGATATASVGVTVHGWLYTLVDNLSDKCGWHPDLALLGNYPAIAYAESDSDLLRYAVSSSFTGASRNDWTKVTVDTEIDLGAHPSLLDVNSRPAIAYRDDVQGTLNYIRATSRLGEEEQDWGEPMMLDDTGDTGKQCSMAIVDGNPAISYHDSEKGGLRYIRSTSSTGAEIGDWTQKVLVDNSGGITGNYTSLAVVDGNPAITYLNDSANLNYTRSSTATGSDPADWSLKIEIDTVGGYDTQLLVIDGRPAIAHSSLTSIRYSLSSTAAGELPGDWQTLSLLALPGTVRNPGIAVVHGKPVVIAGVPDYDCIFMSRSDTAAGENSFNWTETQLDSPRISSGTVSVAQVDGKLAMAFRSFDDGFLYFAMLY